MKNIVFLICISVFFSSCSNDNSLDPSFQSDSELRGLIIGNWSNGYVKITFNVNKSFEEIIFKHDSTTNELVPDQQIRGTYQIAYGILNCDVDNWEILNESLYPNGMGASSPASKIRIENNQLYREPVYVLTRTCGIDGNIYGSWSTLSWSISYYPQGIPQHFYQMEQYYTFKMDSSIILYGRRLVDDTTHTKQYTKSTFEYNPPYLSWDFNYNKRIEFNRGKMHMFEKNYVNRFPLLRQK